MSDGGTHTARQRRCHRPRVAVGVGMVLVLAACSGVSTPRPTAPPSPAGSTAGSDPPASPTAAPSPGGPGIEVRSEEHGYTLILPAGWKHGVNGGSWTRDRIVHPENPGVAYAYDADSRYGLFHAAAPVEPGTTLQQVVSSAREVMDRETSCHGEPESVPADISGKPAVLSVYDRSDCTHDHHVLNAHAIHDGRVLALVWLAPIGESNPQRGTFEQILDSVEFKD